MTGTNRKAPPLGVYLAHNPEEILFISKDMDVCTRQFRATGNVERRVGKGGDLLPECSILHPLYSIRNYYLLILLILLLYYHHDLRGVLAATVFAV